MRYAIAQRAIKTISFGYAVIVSQEQLISISFPDQLSHSLSLSLSLFLLAATGKRTATSIDAMPVLARRRL
jgi:hypothetical protein